MSPSVVAAILLAGAVAVLAQTNATTTFTNQTTTNDASANAEAVNAEVGVEAGLNKGNNLSLRSVLQDSYNTVPTLHRLKNDLKLITSLVYKF